MAALREYKSKRHFEKTPEPGPKVKTSSSGRLYVIQKHAARQLHYDFRLELDGVLLSWAVPKGPSLDPTQKRLAMHVEDHPVDYGSFEGTIPKGQYGGGTVMLWDTGEWVPVGDPHEGYKKGDFKFELKGTKLQGRWVLVRIRNSRDGGGRPWLLIKEKDEHVRSHADYDILEKKPKSVASGRDLDQIAKAGDAVWHTNREPKNQDGKSSRRIIKSLIEAEKQTAPDPAKLNGAVKRAQPDTLSPQLATLAKTAPEGEQWLHEIKFDGYRILSFIEKGSVRLLTRRGNDWTSKFPPIAEAVRSLGFTEGILDGEVVVLNANGTTSFQKLQNTFKHNGQHRLTYFVFDAPYFGGYELTRVPLLERKNFLRQLLAAAQNNSIRYSDHVQGGGKTVLSKVCQLGMEGLICKRANSSYQSKRAHSWLKVKCTRGQEFVIGGFTDPTGLRTAFGALLIGYYDDDKKLRYAGRVGTGFNEKTLREIYSELKKLEIESPPFVNPPRGYDAKGAHWTKPTLIAEVEFGEWTDEGILRHPSFKGLRADKNPKDIVREIPQPPPAETPKVGSAVRTIIDASSNPKPKIQNPKSISKSVIAGVTLSNPDKILYPNPGITKRELAQFHESIADYILPHIIKRPLTIVRCPMGQGQKCFYQKHIKEATPPSIYGIPIKESAGVEDYIAIKNLHGLISLVQMGVLEIHPWGSRKGKIEQPDRVVIDLDPGPDVDWKTIIAGAVEVRNRLEEVGLQSWPRTSGGKGLHVVVPLTPRAEWDAVKEFTKRLVETIVRDSPGKYIAIMTKAKRGGKIFLDYLRNGRGATSIASYSTRARENAPVATPLTWKELEGSPEKIGPASFTVRNLSQRLAKLKNDPWQGFFEAKQSLTAAMQKKMGM